MAQERVFNIAELLSLVFDELNVHDQKRAGAVCRLFRRHMFDAIIRSHVSAFHPLPIVLYLHITGIGIWISRRLETMVP